MAIRLIDLRAEHLTEPPAVPSESPTFAIISARDLPRGRVSEPGRPLGEVVGVEAITESADAIDVGVSSIAYESEVEQEGGA